MFKTLGVVIWVALFALVVNDIARSEKINTAPHATGQLHHIGKNAVRNANG